MAFLSELLFILVVVERAGNTCPFSMQKFLLFLSFIVFIGCSNTTPPEPEFIATNLSAYFAKQSSIERQIWNHDDMRVGHNDSLFSYEFIGQSSIPSSDGYSPISIYQFLDSTGKLISKSELYISDKLIVSYGDSSLKLNRKRILLRDTLKVEKRWEVAGDFLTPDSAHVMISAYIDTYYPNIRVGDSVYNNVFRAEYLMKQLGSASSLDEYKEGAKHISYYAENVGVVLQYIYDNAGALLWKNELLEQRIK